MSVFKKCTCCDNPWFSREEFLGDSKLDFVGYQVNFTNLELGYFLFNELPDAWGVVGATVIMGSCAYIVRREAMIRKEAAFVT